MWGLIYKDVCVCRKSIILSFVATLIITILFVIIPNFLFNLLSDSEIDDIHFYLMLPQVIGYFCIFMSWVDIVTSFISVDEKAVWVNFVSSSVTPKVQIQSKYCEGIIAVILICSWCFIADSIGIAIAPESYSLSSMIMLFMFTLIVIWAFEIPFTVFFGSKYGGYVKMSIFLALFATVIIYTLYGSSDTFFNKFEKLINSQESTFMLSINALFPYTACILYLLSYKISCKLYLKGAETNG
jgi:hypothetical protein